jgi:CTP:molybdopterin cytidylyltransferase MocA
MVAGAILAAGRSVRMGQPKAMLRTPDGLTFVARLIRTLSTGGVDAPLVVARSDDDLLRSEVESAGARLVINPDADEGGQLSSLLAGLRKADRPGVRALMVVPVDAPMVMPETVAKLIAVFNDSHGSIIRARYQGRNGHPVIFRVCCSTNSVTHLRKPERRPYFALTRTILSTWTSTIRA